MTTARDFEFTLTQAEVAEILIPVGSGGQQTFHEWILSQLQGGNRRVAFDDRRFAQLIRYMSGFYGPGGFQTRLRRAFGRPLRELLSF